jgi:hypothetical protein
MYNKLRNYEMVKGWEGQQALVWVKKRGVRKMYTRQQLEDETER